MNRIEIGNNNNYRNPAQFRKANSKQTTLLNEYFENVTMKLRVIFKSLQK